MSRKPIGNEKRNEKISVSVTPTVFSNIKTLADVTHKGNVNGLIVELIEGAIQKNISIIERVSKIQREYQSVLVSATAEYNNSLAQ